MRFRVHFYREPVLPRLVGNEAPLVPDEGPLCAAVFKIDLQLKGLPLRCVGAYQETCRIREPITLSTAERRAVWRDADEFFARWLHERRA